MQVYVLEDLYIGELKDANKLSEYNYMQNETYKSA